MMLASFLDGVSNIHEDFFKWLSIQSFFFFHTLRQSGRKGTYSVKDYHQAR